MLIFALSVINSSILLGFIPFFSPNKFVGLINDNVLLNIVTLTLSPDFLSFPFNLASE